MNVVEKLRSLVNEIRAAPAPPVAKDEWELAARLLGRMPVDQEEVKRACGEWDVEALDALVSQLEGKAAAPAQKSEAVDVDPHDLDRALRTFRKRLKLARLNDESRLGGGRKTTSGRKSQIHAMQAPHEFPHEVWQALARDGRLKDEGGGFYSLTD